jgi:hypothetical protein
MAKVRQLFNTATIKVAKRRRICHRNRRKHSITAGQPCLVLKDPASGISRNYCVECATAILDRAQTDLDALREELVAKAMTAGH